jgi:hypothetical protein
LRTLEIIINDNTVLEWLQEGIKNRELLFLKFRRNEKDGNPVVGVL